MDELDFKIIKKIIANCRVPFSRISNELGVSTITVIRRYNKLKAKGVIMPSVYVDIFKLGYCIRVWYMISLVSQINKSTVLEEISKIPDVVRIIKAVGEYDLLAIVAVKDFKHMFEIGEKLEKIEGIEKIEARQFLPLTDPNVPKSATHGFFNPNLLEKI
ncbi:MAG: Lrp/AsnC family transcriptional regulator [Candidatus Bathyarchaeota archaeon]|nr:Lrp/AsnC family transcriptional regulator [Candidatus Bathyarchaeum tardum]WGM88586.1 MAG: Lrp/AsnC family transcriptional regulator [Candidatus Bathyarchaeum tardum]WNZ29158.1 MAG: Lrp/AsnC family transcriptional regulator [Candidatus Bathyarchaeota archaeon]